MVDAADQSGYPTFDDATFYFAAQYWKETRA